MNHYVPHVPVGLLDCSGNVLMVFHQLLDRVQLGQMLLIEVQLTDLLLNAMRTMGRVAIEVFNEFGKGVGSLLSVHELILKITNIVGFNSCYQQSAT